MASPLPPKSKFGYFSSLGAKKHLARSAVTQFQHSETHFIKSSKTGLDLTTDSTTLLCGKPYISTGIYYVRSHKRAFIVMPNHQPGVNVCENAYPAPT